MFWVDSFNSIVQLDFDYCSVVWGNCGFGLCEKIQKLQDRAARIILYASNEDDIDELFQALSGRTKSSKTDSHLCYDAQYFIWIDPWISTISIYIPKWYYFTPTDDADNKLLVVPQPRTNYLKKTFSCRGAMFSNSLSHELRATVPLCEFKIKVRHYSFEWDMASQKCSFSDIIGFILVILY